jgi:AcrR family transcriptional regulator
MSVKFDAITPVLTPEQLRQQQQRVADRQARQQRFGDERRQQLLDVAWALWQEAGGQGFNMRQLAQRAGYTAGALYAYFPGREAILSALQQRVVQELADLVAGIKAPRGERGPRPRKEGGTVSSVQAVQARTLFIERSVAWWACLAGDSQRLQLVLHGGHGLQDAAGEATGSSSPKPFSRVWRPCRSAGSRRRPPNNCTTRCSPTAWVCWYCRAPNGVRAGR